MSLTMRRIFLCLIGLIAGLAVWPVAETAITMQEGFNSYLSFSIFLGFIFGMCMGAFFGTGEGITLSIRHRIFSGMLTGAIIGIIGGAIGFFIGQGALFILGEVFVSSGSFRSFGFPVSRAIGWAILGLFIGMIEGVRSGSMIKIKTGIIGGLIGGFLGGLALEYVRLLVNDIMFARLLGLLIFGLMIGLFYSLVESRLSAGVLRLLNGKYKGKMHILNQRRVRIGRSAKNDICINGYQNVLAEHALLYIKEHKQEKEVILRSLNPAMPVMINDKQIKEHILRLNDVIQIGTAKFLFKLI